MSLRVICDSIIAPSLQRAEEALVRIVPLNIHFGPSVYEDLHGLDPDDFYARLKDSSELPTTSAPSVGRFQNAFREALSTHEGCICLTVGRQLSNTFNIALQAKETFSGEKKARIGIFDTTTAGAAGAILVLKAYKMAKEGLTLPAIEKALAALREKTTFIGMIDSLDHIERSGRVGRLAAFSTGLFRLKPLFSLENAEIRPFGLARGRRQAVKRLLSRIKKDARDAKRVSCVLTDARDNEGLSWLKKGLSQIENVVIEDHVPFTPAMGAHTGEGVLGVGYLVEKD